ncbi:ABZJ_00895 family protein [Peteryoungia algae]|uniref:ABZJ_00895 family protein n=1 Tax=Peteryoungia algae TaxID=2919917 RepID=A0ABT0D4W5_9HYPH|nr:ABZJ_00895 family protein [Rhizobium sp. SSM4.3]MCJ8240344.1 ABZJ_00895 family protein [Rhizobium sp. SSM4.3]
MTSLLPGLLTRYVLVLIGAQILVYLLVLVLDAYGWGDSLSSAGNVAVLMAGGSTAGSFVAQRLRARPSWGSSLRLSALLCLVAVLLGSLILVGVVFVNGFSWAELQMLAGQMDMTPVTAALVLAGVSLALSFPVTLAGFRLGASQVAKQIEKQDSVTGI